MPKFGELIATDVWEAAARTLTDFSAEEIFDLPAFDDTYKMASPVASVTADTYGSWAELAADVGVGKRLILLVVHASTVLGYTAVAEIEIGEGAGGSEVAITRVFLSGANSQHTSTVVFPVYRKLTDNARLSCRTKDSDGGAFTERVMALIG